MNDPPIVGEWIRISHLGEGGFGVVTLWKSKETEQFIAVKKCRWTDSNQLTKRQKERWCSEVEMMKKIKHDNVVSYVSLPVILEIALSRVNPTKLPLLSMEYCSKGNLRHILTLPENTCGLPESDVKTILMDLLNGVSYLHSLKITHRDLKPENIVLQHCDTRPNKIIYKVIDLGYAKELDTAVASFVGTLQYLAPEICLAGKYDHTVDYWSLGIVVFEIVSGIHPFLPFHPLPKRIESIKNKKPDDIYIYISDHGHVNYSSEFPKEIHISMCLKQDLEKWLRLVLQLDPANRGTKVGTNVFVELMNVLTKKIVTVFSMYTYEFYYYEINECTLLSTLQDWFEKDAKIKKSDQLVICDQMFLEEDDNRRVLDCFSHGVDSIIIIFKKEASLAKVIPNIPKLMKLMFQNDNEFKWDIIKLIYGQTIYFVFQENLLFTNLLRALHLFIVYLDKLLELEMEEFKEMKSAANKLLPEVDCYGKFTRNIIKKYGMGNKELINNLNFHQSKLVDLKTIILHINKLNEKHNKLHYNKKIFDEHSKTISSILKTIDLETRFKDAVHLAKTSRPEGRKTISSDSMRKVADATIKDRHTVLKIISKQWQYFNSGWKIYNRCWKYISKARALQEDAKDVATSLFSNLFQILDIIYKSAANGQKSNIQQNNHSYYSCLDVSAEDILQENTNIRYLMQEEIDKSLLIHKSAIDDEMNLNIK